MTGTAGNDPNKSSAQSFGPSILIAEDDDEMRRLLGMSLRAEGYQVTECSDGAKLLDHLSSLALPAEQASCDLIISDIRMPGASGLDIVEALGSSTWFPPTILITAFGDEETHAEASRLGVKAVFNKPFDIVELVLKVHQIVPIPRVSETNT